MHEERFCLCQGPSYTDVLDEKPENEELPFLPLLQSKKGIEIEVELVISQFKNTNYAFDLQDQPIVFSISHYVDLDFINMYTYFKNTVLATHCTNNHSKTVRINVF